MAREPTTLQQERDRLAAVAADPRYLERKQQLFEQRSSELADRLMPDVRGRLNEEATSEVADAWLNEAREVLRGLVSDKPESSAAFQQALHQSRTELSKSLSKELIAPSEAEIDAHAQELAQLVIGNWLAILEQAPADREAIALTVNGLPERVEQLELYEGIEAFVVPRSQVTVRFLEYVDSLSKSGSIVELVPNRFLAFKGGESYFARTREAAERIVEPVEAKRSSPTRAVLDQLLQPFLKSKKPASLEPAHPKSS